MRIVLLLERNVDPALGSDQSRFHFIQRSEVLIHSLAVRRSKLPIERTRTLRHGIHKLDTPLQGLVLRLDGLAVTSKQSVEDTPRIIFGGNRPSFEVVGDRSRS